jgi:hypothetical protein
MTCVIRCLYRGRALAHRCHSLPLAGRGYLWLGLGIAFLLLSLIVFVPDLLR